MEVLPLYTIHRYRDDIYKVVAFKRRQSERVFIKDEENHNETKLSNNISRARSMVLQYALCNPWEYFFTGTLDKSKMDRYDLDAYSVRLSQFIRDMRKKYKSKISVLLVPEMHGDGAWHMHGMINNLPSSVLRHFEPPAPERLIRGGFLNWPDYADKFGFCSLGVIRDPVATAFYITKYINKDLDSRQSDLGKHLYFHSRPLKKAECAAEIYAPNMELERYCTEDYEFCKVGMVENEDWTFPVRFNDYDIYDFDTYMASKPVVMSDPLKDFNPVSIDPTYEQLKIF